MRRSHSLIVFIGLALPLAIGTLIDSRPATSQTGRSESAECGSDVTPEEAQRYLDILAKGLPNQQTQLPPPPYCVPIAGHIVRSSAGTGGMPLSQYNQAIQDANGG